MADLHSWRVEEVIHDNEALHGLLRQFHFIEAEETRQECVVRILLHVLVVGLRSATHELWTMHGHGQGGTSDGHLGRLVGWEALGPGSSRAVKQSSGVVWVPAESSRRTEIRTCALI